jgi:hypothetical protein
MAKNSNSREGNEHKKRVWKALGHQPDIVCFNSPSGLFMAPSGALVRVNKKGFGDLTGFILWRGLPISFACECKWGTGSLDADQRQWRDAWIRRGGLYFVCRDHEKAVSQLLAELDKKITQTFFQDGK